MSACHCSLKERETRKSNERFSFNEENSSSLSRREQPSSNQRRESSSSGMSLRGYAENGDRGGREYKSSSSSSTSSSRSLASLVAGSAASTQLATGKRGVSQSSSSPFATSMTANQLHSFDDLETQLTQYMTEKTSLTQELAR